MTPVIALRGVRVHNLQAIDVDIPLGKLTAVTGVSGAGKSSLVFDTLYAEAQRRYLQSFSVAVRQQLEQFDRPDVESIGDLPPAVAVRTEPNRSTSRADVGSVLEISDQLRLLLARAGVVHCLNCGQAVQPASTDHVLAALTAMPSATRATIAFPSRPDADQDTADWAATLRAQGFTRLHIDGVARHLDELTGDNALPAFPALLIVDRVETGKTTNERLRESIQTAFERGRGRMTLITEQTEQTFERGWRCVRCDASCPEPQPRLFDRDDPLGACPACNGTGLTGGGSGKRKRAANDSDDHSCSACHGHGWNKQALSVRLQGHTISDLAAMSFRELVGRIDKLTALTTATDVLAAELRRRVGLANDSGLGHLNSSRPVRTLATGEAQQLQLCAALARDIVGALYLLDEPAAGFHPARISGLVAQLEQLRDAGNTVVIIEHHADLIRAADHVIDLGPGAGEEGGRVVVQGSVADLGACRDSATGQHLLQERGDGLPRKRRAPQGWLRLNGVHVHNLRDLAVELPLGVLCAVTGVAGAGKKSLIANALYPCLARLKGKTNEPSPPEGAQIHGAGQIADVLLVDQEPLPQSVRSNPASYLKILDDVRELFGATAEAKIRGFGPGHFSFNQPGGRCDACEGRGRVRVDMQFLTDVTMTCPECHGSRYRKEILTVKVRNLSIAEVLDMTVREAFRFFRAQRRIQHRLKWLLDVGLEYVRLGQATDTLSSGECQRLKLAGHLAASHKPRSLFLLIEPSAGLHPADVGHLLTCFDGLVQAGHSLILIEHNLDMILHADHVIDLGPGAGPDGGQVVAQGTPEAVASVPGSLTGRCLARRLQ